MGTHIMGATILRRRPIRPYDLSTPAFAGSGIAKAGHELVDLRSLGILPGIGGGAPGPRGIANEGDLITQLPDGTDVNELWRDYQDALNIYNAERQRIVDLLTFNVQDATEMVVQSVGADFEEASEYGVPVAIGTAGTPSTFSVGFGFKWYDLGLRYTWKFLIDAPQAQVDALHNAAMEADNRNVFKRVMKTVFNGNNELGSIHGSPFNVYKFYNADGTVPPSWKTYTFTGTHQHYLTSGAATVDSGDVDDLYEHLRHHGYGSIESGTRMILLVNPAQGDVIKNFRTPANGGTATHDSVTPTDENAANWPFYRQSDAVQTDLVGRRPPSRYQGLTVVCQYGPILVCSDDYIPAGYMFMFATGGDQNLSNPVGFREHANAGLRGLKLVKGPNNDYPLVDSYYRRGFGTGVRHRGAGAVMQITANASYSVPAEYV